MHSLVTHFSEIVLKDIRVKAKYLAIRNTYYYTVFIKYVGTNLNVEQQGWVK